MRLLITRPHDDAVPLQAALSAVGHEGLIAPLLTIKNLNAAALDLSHVQGLVLTSANGGRALAGRRIDPGLPVFAVGDTSVGAARELGFHCVRSANGDVTDLARVIMDTAKPENGPLLHVTGRKIAGDLAGALARAGFRVRRAVLYEAHLAEQLPAVARIALGEEKLEGALFFSPRTAASFGTLVHSADLVERCAPLVGFCLSAAVAAEIRQLPWRQVIVARAPTQSALLAAIADFAKRT